MFRSFLQTEDRTYSFRRRTMEATIDSTTKKPPVTPAAEGKLKCETLLLFFSHCQQSCHVFSIHGDSIMWNALLIDVSLTSMRWSSELILWFKHFVHLYTKVFMCNSQRVHSRKIPLNRFDWNLSHWHHLILIHPTLDCCENNYFWNSRSTRLIV